MRNRPSGPTWAERCCAIVAIPKENPGATRLGTACRPDTFRLVSRSALVALVIANAFVALQTLRHDWGFYEVTLVYWVEVVILGVYNVLRMLVVGLAGAFAAIMILLKLGADAASHVFEHHSLAPEKPSA